MYYITYTNCEDLIFEWDDIKESENIKNMVYLLKKHHMYL